jgi:hypothetical protein
MPRARSRQAIVTLESWSEAFDGADDLGPMPASVSRDDSSAPHLQRPSLRAHALIVFRIEASADVPPAIATRTFADLSVSWPFLAPHLRDPEGAPAAMRTYAHQLTEFALPVFGDDKACGFMFAPHRPAVVQPLMFIAADGRSLMLAPLDHFHEQTIAVPPDRDHADHGVHCSWHGDLAAIRRGLRPVNSAPRPARARSVVLRCCATERRRAHRYADDGVGKLSYWTDNGALYYTEPAMTIRDAERAVTSLHGRCRAFGANRRSIRTRICGR